MSKPYDSTLKQIVDLLAPDWIRWLAPRLGLPADVSASPLDADLSTVQPVADKVFRLDPPGSGVVLLEVQSAWAGDLPDRLLLYSVLLEQRHGGPVYAVAVLLRRDANSPSLGGTLTRTHPGGRAYLRFEYEVIRVWDLPADALLAGGLGTAPLGLLTDDAAPRLGELVQRFADRVAAEVPSVETQNVLLTGSYILMGMRYDKDTIHPLFHGIQKMRESSTYQAILEEGLEEGLELGREEGEIASRQQDVLDLLEERSGAVPTDVAARVRGCRDAARLRTVLRQCVRIAAAADLQVPPAESV